MPRWTAPITALTLITDDLPATKRFYETVFGLPVYFEDDSSVFFDFGNTLINLLARGSADELIAPASVGSGTRSVFTITAPDVDAAVADLEATGVALLNGPMDRPWGIRTASFVDPAGQLWEVAS